MGLGSNAETCDFGDNDLADDGGIGADCDSRDGDDGFGLVVCSICLEIVDNNCDRSWAKLQCGHQFHLDCIGSAFNAKGMMQCPNCRKVEKGQWLYANGSRTIPEFNFEEWAHEEEMYDLAYSEMAFGVHWCPFGNLARLPSFEDGEYSPSTYHDLFGQHGFFAEPAAASAGHPCPYIAYFGPVHPSSSNSAAAGSDSSSFSSHWNSTSSVAGEVPMPYGFAAVEPHYHAWDYHSPHPPPPPFSTPGTHIGSPPQPTNQHMAQRIARLSSELIRPRPAHYMRPFLGHSSGGSVAPAQRVLPYPGSSARTRDRVQALQAYYQQSPSLPRPIESPAVSRPPVYPSGQGMGSTSSSSDQSGGGFIRFNIWEREQFMQPQALSVNQVDRESSSPWTTGFTEGSGSSHQTHGGGSS